MLGGVTFTSRHLRLASALVLLATCHGFAFTFHLHRRQPPPITSCRALASDNDDATSQPQPTDSMRYLSETDRYLGNVASDVADEVTTKRTPDTTSFSGVKEWGLSDFQTLADSTISGFSTVAEKGSSDLQSLADSTFSGLSSVTERGASDFQSFADSTFSGISSVAEKGSSDFQSLADNTLSGFTKVAEFGLGTWKDTTTRAKYAARSTRGAFGFAEKRIAEIQSLTQDGTLKLGETAKWIDSQAKSGTEMVSSKAKSLVLDFTGKENYNFGDVTNELARRIAQKEIMIQDTVLLIKILLAVGASIGPLAKALPLTVLMEALNLSLEARVGTKVLEALASSLDTRIIAAFSSDDKVQIGDAVKRTLLSGVLAFTGKSKYESGDIGRVVKGQAEGDADDVNKTLSLQIDPELQEWDRLFLESCLKDLESSSSDQSETSSAPALVEQTEEAKILDMKIALALEEVEALSKQT